MPDIAIRIGTRQDAAAIRELYVTVSAISGGLARLPHEVTADYVDEFVCKSVENGVLFIADDGSRMVGELHAYPYEVWRLKHVLSHLTVAIHPDEQGKGIGRKLFETLLAHVRAHRPDIERIELITQESNERGRRLYESVGFRREGTLVLGIRNSAGHLENDVPMGWVRSREA